MDSRRVYKLFRDAREIDSTEERLAFVARHADDTAVREEVTTLLGHHFACPAQADDSVHGEMRAAVESVWEGSAAEGGLPAAIGPYRILGRLGHGGMATVFRAQQERPQREVALKMLHLGSGSSTALARFTQEAELLGRLQHDGIAQVFDSGVADTSDGPRAYLTMELVDGGDLLAYAHEQTLDTEQRIDLILQILEATAYAHQCGVIHRDLKPSNVLVTGRGRCKLLDFGIAHVVGDESRHTATGDVLGTLRYMSPEQATGGGERARLRSDVYAIGVMAYELLAGRHPLDDVAGRGAELLSAIIGRDAPALSVVAPALPRDLTTVIHKAVERDPDRRYATADAFASDLRRYLAGEPVEARDPTFTYQLRKFVGRNKAFVAGLGVAALGLIVAVVLSLSYARRAEEDRKLANKRAADVIHGASLSHLRVAAQDIRDDRFLAASRNLSQIPDHQRTWAWSLLNARCDTRIASTGPITSRTAVVVEPAGALSLRPLDEGDGRLARKPGWGPQNLAYLNQVVVLRHGDNAEKRACVPYSPTGQQPVRGPSGGTLQLSGYDAILGYRNLRSSAGRKVTRLDSLRVTAYAQADQETKVIVATLTGSVHIWDPIRDVIETTPIEIGETVTAVAVAPGSKRIAVAGQAGGVRIYDLESAEVVESFSGVSGIVDFLTFADGTRYLIARSRVRGERRGGVKGEVRFHLWAPGAIATLEVVPPETSEANNYVYGVDVSPDGRLIALASWPNLVRVLDRRSLRVLHRRRPAHRVLDVLLSPDGRRATCRLTQSLIEVHDFEGGTQPRTVPNTGITMGLARGADDDEVLWLDNKTGAVGSLRTRGPLPAVEDQPSGEPRPAHERCPLVFDRQTGLLIRGTQEGWMSMTWPGRETRYEFTDATGRKDPAYALAVWPGSGEVIRGTVSGRISFDPLDGGAPRLAFAAHTGSVYALAIHPSGRVLASGGKDGVIRLWDCATGDELLALSGHTNYVHDLAFTPDGTTLLSGSGDGTARLWSSEPLRDRLSAAQVGR